MSKYKTESLEFPNSKSLHKDSEEIVTVIEIQSDIYDENQVYHSPYNGLNDLSLGNQNTEQLRELFKTFNQ